MMTTPAKRKRRPEIEHKWQWGVKRGGGWEGGGGGGGEIAFDETIQDEKKREEDRFVRFERTCWCVMLKLGHS